MPEIPFDKTAVERLRTERPEVAQEVCQHWPTVRAVLTFIKSLPIVPQEVKDAIDWIIKLGDGLCPK